MTHLLCDLSQDMRRNILPSALGINDEQNECAMRKVRGARHKSSARRPAFRCPRATNESFGSHLIRESDLQTRDCRQRMLQTRLALPPTNNLAIAS